jgi:hypothetical protein
VECECGCEWAGYDDVTQYLIEEALYERLEHVEREVKRRMGAATSFEDTALGDSGMSPGEEAAVSHAAKMAQLGVA